jgi:hypothetical protein
MYHSDLGFDKTFTDPEWGAVTAKSMLDQGNVSGDADYAPFHDLDDEVPADVRAKMEQINTDLLNGSIKTGVPASKPQTD